MASIGYLRNAIENEAANTTFAALYGNDSIGTARERYKNLLSRFLSAFGTDNARLFSAAGRSEIGGNHTDHNNGKVLAAALGIDALAAVAPKSDDIVEILSDGFPTVALSAFDLSKRDDEIGTSAALVRGVLARLSILGYTIGGFRACIHSTVPAGSGLSSSACYEVLICTIINHIYNEGKIPPVIIAQTAQYAENTYFGKPSGLMDQLASAVGGFTAIDFADTDNPIVTPVPFAFENSGYTLAIVKTGGSHADLSDAYAAIKSEMLDIAGYFGCENMRGVNESDFYAHIPHLRENFSDRAFLRAMHYINENKRVDNMRHALENNNFMGFLNLVNSSGQSSWQLLQNITNPNDPMRQPIALALALTSEFLNGDGACRVHGGGFAGTIQAYIPNARFAEYESFINSVFGDSAVIPLTVRHTGATEIIL